jgi:hypothetical protein
MKQVTSVGPYGATVTILQRRKGGRYVLRWTDPHTRKPVAKTTEFKVLTKAKEAALDKSKELLQHRDERPQDGRAVWSDVFRHYEDHYLPLYGGTRQAVIDRGCLAVWRAVLPPSEAVEDCEAHVLKDFIRRRQLGAIQPPGRVLRPCGPRTPALDLEWLRRAINLASGDGKRIARNPVKLVEIPKTTRPKQPDATWDRYLALRPHCEGVGSQDIFGGFMDLVVGLGWRVTAVACLHLKDVDRTARPDAPHGRILKRAEFDKQGYEQWVPISNWLAPRIDVLLTRRRAFGPGLWLFPSPKDTKRPWTPNYAKARLAVAERKAGLEPIDGGNFHPWRRMWATLRKHLPLKDVAYAGCWDERTLLRHYQKSDSHTVLAVMNAGLPE